MNTKRRAVLAVVSFVASLTALAAFLPVPQSLRVILGVPMVFFLPGFATLPAVFPSGRLSRAEILVASLGISLAATVCLAVLLGSLPIGLTRGSFSVALSGTTLSTAACAWFRGHPGGAARGNRNTASREMSHPDHD
jgi:uncharacterized membrane protein